jgi:hypothetical protein
MAAKTGMIKGLYLVERRLEPDMPAIYGKCLIPRALASAVSVLLLHKSIALPDADIRISQSVQDRPGDDPMG